MIALMWEAMHFRIELFCKGRDRIWMFWIGTTEYELWGPPRNGLVSSLISGVSVSWRSCCVGFQNKEAIVSKNEDTVGGCGLDLSYYIAKGDGLIPLFESGFEMVLSVEFCFDGLN